MFARVCRLLPWLLVCLLSAYLLSACAAERVEINRVQANALDKAFFVGKLDDPKDDPEFFMRTAVIDVMFGANSDGLITSADGQATTRIRWEITEKSLIARLTYELVQDSDHKGSRTTADGQIVAAFAIERHFDIKREYNATTGEEMNVVLENDVDRPWHQRAYFRVDWSRNLVTNAYTLDTLSQIGILYAVAWEPLAYYVSEPSHPDAPVFSSADGYFDITHKALAKPGLVSDEWGEFPACWLVGAFPEQSCNPTEVKLRTSFLRVQDHDFEPVDWTGERMDIAGVFTQDRVGFETGYGLVDNKWHRFAARWNLHPKSHVDTVCATPATTPTGADVHRDADGDGTEDECKAVGRGARCDEFRHRCTVPLRDRDVRTIPWYVNPGFPADLFDVTRHTVAVWDDAVRVGLLAGRLAECRRTGEANCEATHGWPSPWSDDFVPPLGSGPQQVPHVFVLCHNPVQAGDDTACGAVGLAPRMGDLRYNLITHITAPQTMSPWGIMVDAEDPLTGEKISGSVNIWGERTEHAAAQLADLLMLEEGLLDPKSYIQGKNLASWIEELRKGGPEAHAGRPVSKVELERHRRAFDPKALAPLLDGLQEPAAAKLHPQLARKKRLEALSNLGRLGPGNGALAERVRRLQGSALEAKMVSPEMAQLAGADPKAPPSQATVARASPFGHQNPARQRAMRRQGLLTRAQHGSCRLDRADVEPDNLLGLAALARQQFGTPDAKDAVAVAKWRKQVYDWARKAYHKGVMAHELGHSMGLRHNFAASFDSLNYDLGYWQLRTQNGTVTDECPDGTTDGSKCIGPRWRDPISQVELENNIGAFATTSVMDYPGDTSQDQRLLGKYDRAAMRFIYGGVVDVWSAPGLSVGGKGADKLKAYKLTAFASSPGLTGVYQFPTGKESNPYVHLHYSRYPQEFGLLGACSPSSEPGAMLGQKCQGAPLDVVDYRDMQPFSDDPNFAQFSWGRVPRAIDKSGRVRRGYLFQSDEFADAGNVTTFTDDAGADAYEIVRFLESQYELRYVLDNFRRNRTTFHSDAVVGRIQSRYLDPIQSIAKTFAFGALLDGDPTAPSAKLLADGNYGPLSLAASTAFELFARILTRPEPGYYCSSVDCYFVPQPSGVTETVYGADLDALPDVYGYNFQIPLGPGRFVHNEFDYSQGYYWGDYQTQVGTYYDKVWAVWYLGEAFDNFISNSKEDFVDGRYKNVNFATVYPEQVRRLYNALLTGDLSSYAPRAIGLDEAGNNPAATPVLYPDWLAPDGLPAPAAKAKLMSPAYGWNERIYAMTWGTLFFTTNWSYDFVNQARLVTNANDLPDWKPSEIRSFYDPKSGLTWRARSTGTELLGTQLREKAAGARMVEWANHLLAEAYLVERDSTGAVKWNGEGAPTLVLDAAGKPQLDAKHPGAAAELQGYVDQMAMFQQLTSTFAQPVDALPQP